RAEPLLLDEPTGHARSHLVELVRAVGCLTHQHEMRVADQIEQRLPLRAVLVQRLERRTQRERLGRALVSGAYRARRPALAQQVSYFVVGRLTEIPVGLPHRE